MSSRQCQKCGRRYPSSYRKCPYCSGQERETQRPGSPLDQILGILRQRSSHAFVTCSLVFLCIAILGIFISRCSQPKDQELEDSPQKPVQTAPVIPLTLSQNAVSLHVGEAVVISASGNYDTLIWTSSDEAVASVNSGTVTGRAAGSATITASTGVNAVSCEVVVEEVPAPVSHFELALSSTDFTLRSGDPPVQMKVRIKGTRDVYEGEVVWASQDVNVVTVSESGLVERVGRGTTTVTATADGQTLECIVRVP